MGAEQIGIGRDLCQAQPDSVVEWRLTGRWTTLLDLGDGEASYPGFPDQPSWFRDNRDFGNIEQALEKTGFSKPEVAGIMGGNWLRFYETSFEPEGVA